MQSPKAPGAAAYRHDAVRESAGESSASRDRARLPSRQWPDLIAAMETALSQFSAGAVKQPVRSVIEVGEHRAFFGIMPAALDDPPAVGAKLVTVYERNHHIGLPSHLATIILLDHATGALRAVLDGRYITEARTAADLYGELARRHGFADSMTRCKVAINDELGDWNAALSPGDEVLFFPPVAGG